MIIAIGVVAVVTSVVEANYQMLSNASGQLFQCLMLKNGMLQSVLTLEIIWYTSLCKLSFHLLIRKPGLIAECTISYHMQGKLRETCMEWLTQDQSTTIC